MEWKMPASMIRELGEARRLREQRDQLRDALENVMKYIDTDDMKDLDLNKARAALKATEEGWWISQS